MNKAFRQSILHILIVRDHLINGRAGNALLTGLDRLNAIGKGPAFRGTTDPATDNLAETSFM
ncbi:hypothetical protein ASE60_09085 [Ensifer sp. Root278]|nr:hypothetical protein ASE60_09085 [Ensifer sp. Root278]